MKSVVLFAVFLISVESQTGDWMPIISPILSTQPCKDEKDITVWFEPGRQPKDNNWYYVYANKAFPQDCKIEIAFDSQVNISFVVRTDNNEYSKMTLSEGDTFALHFFMPHMGLGFKVHGTERGITPYLISLSINEVEYCNDPQVGYMEQYAARNTVTGFLGCGRRMMDQAPLIVSGAPTHPGEWPWHAALYKSEHSTIKYICGGTLISNRFVLTAAHCATYRGARYQDGMLNVVLGKYTLTGDDKESEEKEVLEIIIHERFDYRHLVNDIALLKLKTEVVFTDFIRPACIWYAKDNAKLRSAEILGTIVGWGFDSTDSLSRTLRQAKMPIVSEATCLKSNPIFYSHALNQNTFCAGYHNGTSACNGDSGSAFQVFISDEIGNNNNSGTWYVKGIVSNTVARFDAPICDPNEYVVFTNVEKYTDWIEKYIG